MKLFRYRKPSLRTLTGYTRVSRKARRAAGISQIEGYTKPSRIKQKVKYRAGLYGKPARIVRQASRGRFPSFFGLFRIK
jgi:hypothetical protein